MELGLMVVYEEPSTLNPIAPLYPKPYRTLKGTHNGSMRGASRFPEHQGREARGPVRQGVPDGRGSTYSLVRGFRGVGGFFQGISWGSVEGI